MRRRNWTSGIVSKMSMAIESRFLPWITLGLVSLIILGTHPAAVAQNRVSNDSNVGACEREIKKLGPRRLGEKIRQPWKTRDVSPAYPPIPEGTTGGGAWVGEILIDTRGRVSGVWTIREVKLTPPVPSLTKSITDAVAKWEFRPAAVDNVPVPVCMTIALNVNHALRY
jgi:hypothetical protein